MTNHVIPAEAVEAAVFAVARNYGSSGNPTNTILWNRLVEDVRTALEAAAPHMLAAAWDEGAEAECYKGTHEPLVNPYRTAK